MPTYTGGNLLPPILDSKMVLSDIREPLLRFEYHKSEPARLPKHTAQAHNLLIPIQAEPLHARCIRDGQTHDLVLSSGDIVVTPAGTAVAWEWKSAVEVILVWIDPQTMQDFVARELKILVSANTIEAQLVINDLDLLSAAHMLKANLERPDLGQTAMFDALCRVFLTTLVQKYRVKDEVTDIAINAKLSVGRYRSIVNFVDANLDRTISPVQIADVAGVSVSSLNRLFRSTLNTTPSRFLTHYRLKRARALMKDADIPLSNIAVDCGFSDQAHLSRLFKKHFGQTPSSYRSAKTAFYADPASV